MTANSGPTTAPVLIRSDLVVLGGGLLVVVLAGVAHYTGWAAVPAFAP